MGQRGGGVPGLAVASGSGPRNLPFSEKGFEGLGSGPSLCRRLLSGARSPGKNPRAVAGPPSSHAPERVARSVQNAPRTARRRRRGAARTPAFACPPRCRARRGAYGSGTPPRRPVPSPVPASASSRRRGRAPGCTGCHWGRSFLRQPAGRQNGSPPLVEARDAAQGGLSDTVHRRPEVHGLSAFHEGTWRVRVPRLELCSPRLLQHDGIVKHLHRVQAHEVRYDLRRSALADRIGEFRHAGQVADVIEEPPLLAMLEALGRMRAGVLHVDLDPLADQVHPVREEAAVRHRAVAGIGLNVGVEDQGVERGGLERVDVRRMMLERAWAATQRGSRDDVWPRRDGRCSLAARDDDRLRAVHVLLDKKSESW